MEDNRYQKNDIVMVTIEDIGDGGEGIGKVDGYTLFVKDAVIGDTVEARITKCKKNYGYARVEKVTTPSSFRVEPRCRFHRQCGGCQIQAMSYDRQLAFKQEKVRNNLIRIGGFDAALIDRIMEPIVGMEEPWRYRNKAQYPVGYDKHNNLVVGFYAGRTHDIIPNTDCALGAAENKVILEAVLDYMRENRVSAYRETDGTGLVRHVLIRTGFASGQIMVCVVINGKKLPAEERLVEKLRGLVFEREYPQEKSAPERAHAVETPGGARGGGNKNGAAERKIVSIAVSVNEERTNVIMGKEIRVLWGSPYIEDSIRVLKTDDSKTRRRYDDAAQKNAEDTDTAPDAGRGQTEFTETGERVCFRISPLSFYQVNPAQTEKLYSIALDYAGLTGKETVWDLYCGIGTISLFLARHAKQVCGVEVIPQAIEDARENARLNGIENAKFYVGKAEEVLPAFYEGTDETVMKDSAAAPDAASEESANTRREMRHPDVIVVDPPRKGCDEKCLETMLAMRPERIVYVSCDSATLARDLKTLAAGGYELKRVRAVDQFGQNVHVETVCLLSKLNVEHHIEVELNLDEMDLTAAESKASYEEIKAYVLEHSGLKVSNLYIAQVKRKCGIIERENYNKAKAEGVKVPKCPEEKERAIREALEYFKMV